MRNCICVWQSYFDHMSKMNGKKSAADPELRKRIQELIKFKGGGHNKGEIADIIENALKLLTDVKDTGDARVIKTALRDKSVNSLHTLHFAH